MILPGYPLLSESKTVKWWLEREDKGAAAETRLCKSRHTGSTWVFPVLTPEVPADQHAPP